MKIYVEGEASRAICYECGEVKAVTFRLRNVPLSDGSWVVQNIMVGVCNTCGNVVVTPPQSTPAIKSSLDLTK